MQAKRTSRRLTPAHWFQIPNVALGDLTPQVVTPQVTLMNLWVSKAMVVISDSALRFEPGKVRRLAARVNAKGWLDHPPDWWLCQTPNPEEGCADGIRRYKGDLTLAPDGQWESR